MQRVGRVVELARTKIREGAAPAKPYMTSLVDRYRTPRTVQAWSARNATVLGLNSSTVALRIDRLKTSIVDRPELLAPGGSFSMCPTTAPPRLVTSHALRVLGAMPARLNDQALRELGAMPTRLNSHAERCDTLGAIECGVCYTRGWVD